MTTKDKTTTDKAATAADTATDCVKVRITAKRVKFDGMIAGRGSILHMPAAIADELVKKEQAEIIVTPVKAEQTAKTEQTTNA